MPRELLRGSAMERPCAALGWGVAAMWSGNLRCCLLRFAWTQCEAVTELRELSVTPKPCRKLGLPYTSIKRTRKEQQYWLTQSSVNTLIWFLLLGTRRVSKTWPSYRWQEQNQHSQPTELGGGQLSLQKAAFPQEESGQTGQGWAFRCAERGKNQ